MILYLGTGGVCRDLITYFETLISPKKSQLDLIFRTGGSSQDHLSNDEVESCNLFDLFNSQN